MNFTNIDNGMRRTYSVLFFSITVLDIFYLLPFQGNKNIIDGKGQIGTFSIHEDGLV